MSHDERVALVAGKKLAGATTSTIFDTTDSTKPKGWRTVLEVHPAAELFPLVGDAELRDLATDIDQNGLREPVDIYDDPEIGTCVIDGRNRLNALQLIGRVKNFDPRRQPVPHFYRPVGRGEPFDPYAYAISKNIRRRHLTGEQRRNLIAEVLKAKPETSNRQIAKHVKADDKTVAKVRTELEATAEIPQLKKTAGKDGKRRPTRTTKPSATSAPTSVKEPITYDFNRLRATWLEIETQFGAGNKTRLREAIKGLVREGNNALKADRWK